MSRPDGWIEHRRDDREIVGWIAADGDAWRPFDLLGRPATDAPIEWLDAEEVLEARGIGYLSDRYAFAPDGAAPRPVRIAEASTDRVVVVADEYGAASAVRATPERFELPFPVPHGALAPWVDRPDHLT